MINIKILTPNKEVLPFLTTENDYTLPNFLVFRRTTHFIRE
ncbi:hypothetical protein KCTC52924_03255 [Arenibacter antarcticus]